MTADWKPPRLYAIADVGRFGRQKDPERALLSYAEALLNAGVELLQFRDKSSSSRRILSTAQELKRITRRRARLVMNDRPDLAPAADFDGAHLGQEDLSVAGARKVIGDRLLGISTHSLAQVSETDQFDCDYIAFGPVFPTVSKQNPDRVVGIESIRAARSLTQKPLVAIGGITRANCKQVIEAGADSVAVIADLLDSPSETVKEFLDILG